ncbi:hypothetical protein MPNT_10263 [Candidatus Methylacidithermus pantelleriae]|uniref:Cytochrome c-type biogenesis protein H TPR domain-containing protein n=1 Tax=Candidatus Methylacidithermus pantelleriae TaxID=2744239 RepID=A0A8J2BHD6_9BACT|nr:hypothetical protein MPNT_10263 [Candidatus Methylacidithermus pantelleriae]
MVIRSFFEGGSFGTWRQTGISLLVGWLLAVAGTPGGTLYAEALTSPQDRFLELYFILKDAERLEKSGHLPLARQRYQTVRQGLLKLRHDYPEWEPGIIRYRLDFVEERLRKLSGIEEREPSPETAFSQGPPAAPAPQTYRETLAQLHQLRQRVKELEKELAARKERPSTEGALPLAHSSPKRLNGSEPLRFPAPAHGTHSTAQGTHLSPRTTQEPVEHGDLRISFQRELEAKNREIARLQRQLAALEEKGSTARGPEPAAESQAPLASGEGIQQGESATDRVRRATLALQPINPEYTTHRILLLEERGAAFFYEGRLAEAAECYRKILAESPDETNAHANLASVYFSQGKAALAEKELRQALRQDPRNPAAIRGLAHLSLYQGQTRKARMLLQELLQNDPNDLSARNLLATVYFESGNYERACQEARRILAMDPYDTNARVLLRQAQLRAKGQFLGEKEEHHPEDKGITAGVSAKHKPTPRNSAPPQNATETGGTHHRRNSRKARPVAPESPHQSSPSRRRSLPNTPP